MKTIVKENHISMFILKCITSFIFICLIASTSYSQTTTNTVCEGEDVYISIPNVNGTIQWEESLNMTNWSELTGETDDTLHIIASESIYYRAVITDGTCDPIFSDTSYVIVDPLPSNVNVSVNSTDLCEGDDLELTGSADNATTWSWTGPNGYTSNDQNPTINNVSTNNEGVYSLEVSNSCGSSNTVNTANINISETPTTADAGNDQIGASTCGLTSVNLDGNTPTVGTGSWSITSGTGGNINDPSNPTSSFSGTAGNSYTLEWTIENSPCPSSSDQVDITFNQNPTTADAGADITPNCGETNATLNGNTPTVGTGEWTVISGSATITNPNSPTSDVTDLAVQGTAVLRWTISNAPCNDSSDDVEIITSSCGPTCGTQVWAEENADVGTMINSDEGGQEQFDNGVIEKFCYNNVAANCATYGGLYEWGEAMDYGPSQNCDPCGSGGTQGICPTGYHVPTDLEWSRYEHCVETTIAPTGSTNLSTFQNNTWERGTNSNAGPGAKMKVTPSHTPSWDGTNESGFTALPGGWIGGNGESNDLGFDAFFWTATEDGTAAWERDMFSGDGRIIRSTLPKHYGFALRCIKD